MKQTRMGRLTRRALSLLFALTLLWECGALSPKARATDVVAADGTVQFVLWQRVTAWKSRLDEGLKKYCSDGPHPLLLSYESNKTEYLMCVTKDNWRWEKKDYVLAGMPTVYNSPFDEMRGYFLWKDNFMSMSTFNSLWAQYKGTDSNGNPKMLINVSNGADGPGEYLGPGKSYGGQTYGGHKVWDTCFVVRPEETTTWRFFPGDEGARMWNRDYDGSDEDVIFHGSTVVLSDDEREDLRRVFVGYEAISASALTHDFTVQRDQATTMGRPISFIPEDVTLRVASGGVLTVSGALVNDGKIVVEPGGLLVVREMSSIFPYHMDRSNCGGISSAGMIVVEKNGRIIGGGTNGIYLTGGVVYNYGVIASENFTAAKKQLINNQSGAWAIAGRSFGYYDVKRMIEGTYKYFTVGERGGYITDYSRGLAYRSCNLPYAKVNVASGAVYGKTSRFNNYGSYGEAGQMVKVFYHDGASAAEVLSAPSGTLGYQRSATSHTVTRREVVYAGGQIDTLRSQYDQMQNMKQNLPGKTNREFSLIVDTGLTFEQYVEQYFRSQGINLDEKVTVWDGVITVNGLPALTVPWNQLFSAAMKVNGGTMYYVKRQCPAELGDKAISLGSW